MNKKLHVYTMKYEDSKYVGTTTNDHISMRTELRYYSTTKDKIYSVCGEHLFGDLVSILKKVSTGQVTAYNLEDLTSKEKEPVPDVEPLESTTRSGKQRKLAHNAYYEVRVDISQSLTGDKYLSEFRYFYGTYDDVDGMTIEYKRKSREHAKNQIYIKEIKLCDELEIRHLMNTYKDLQKQSEKVCEDFIDSRCVKTEEQHTTSTTYCNRCDCPYYADGHPRCRTGDFD